MHTERDARILQLAVTKGLLRQEDLDPAGNDPGALLARLIEIGKLKRSDFERLQSEVQAPFLKTLSEPWLPHSESSFSDIAGSIPITVFGRYIRLEYVGEGGMARVFKGYDPELRRPVALKFVRVNDPDLAQRLIREARAQARVTHPNVCKVYEAGEEQGVQFIAMQYVEGKNLCQAGAGLELPQKLALIRQVAEAVHAAHQVGLIHRDIKPSNILTEMRGGAGIPFVMDFGLARELGAVSATMSGIAVGTPPYMSPEQARGEVVDRRSDVYSIGATLYELMTGTPPFLGASSTEILL